MIITQSGARREQGKTSVFIECERELLTVEAHRSRDDFEIGEETILF